MRNSTLQHGLSDNNRSTQWKSAPRFNRFYFSKNIGKLIVVIITLVISSSFIVTCYSLPVFVPKSETPPELIYAKRKILWVDSYHRGYEWSDGIEIGIKNVLDETGVDLKIIHMDTKRNTDEAFGKAAAAMVKTEIDTFKPDVVIASDDNAQNYLVVPYLKDTEMPVVFCGVNWDASVYGYPTQNITGMIEADLITQLVDILSKHAPGTRIGFLSDDSTTSRKTIRFFNEQFFDGSMKVYLAGTFNEFKTAFVQAQQEVDILYFSSYAGISNWDGAAAKTFIRENTTIPSGSNLMFMSPYVLITLSRMPEEQGEWAAQTALKILDGQSPADIPVVSNKKGKIYLNMQLAKQLDIVFPIELIEQATLIQ